jgi:hypothetical protein
VALYTAIVPGVGGSVLNATTVSAVSSSVEYSMSDLPEGAGDSVATTEVQAPRMRATAIWRSKRRGFMGYNYELDGENGA